MGLFSPTQRVRGKRYGFLAAGCAATALLLMPQAAHAQQVTAFFTQSGGFFNYNFTVRNNTAVTLADVNILTGASLISNLVAPTGFQTTYDASGNGPGQGIVDFTTTDGVRDFFANTTVSGFLVRSSLNLNGATFNTLDVNGNSFTGNVVATAAPEPGTLGLLAFGAAPAAGALFAFRRRFSSASLKG